MTQHKRVGCDRASGQACSWQRDRRACHVTPWECTQLLHCYALLNAANEVPTHIFEHFSLMHPLQPLCLSSGVGAAGAQKGTGGVTWYEWYGYAAVCDTVAYPYQWYCQYGHWPKHQGKRKHSIQVTVAAPVMLYPFGVDQMRPSHRAHKCERCNLNSPSTRLHRMLGITLE